MFKKITVVWMMSLCMITISLLGILPAADAQTKITLWHYYEDPSGVTELVDAFNKEYAGKIEITAEFLPRAELNKQFTAGVISGKLPDIAVVDNPDHAAYAVMGVFADITDLMKGWPDQSQYFEGPWKSTMYQDKNYGIPLGSNCLALFYNETMLAEAEVSVPETWDELLATAKKLSAKDRYGLAISAVKNEEGTFQYLPWLLSSGADVEHLDSPEAIKSMAILAQLVKDGSMSQEVINWTQADVRVQFMAGKAAMMVNGPWQIATLKSETPDLKWNVVKIPKDQVFASVLGGENLAICKGAEMEAAWEFLKFAAQPKVVEEFSIAKGYFPPRKDVATTAAYWNDDPIFKVFMDQMSYAMPRGPHPKWAQISNAMSTALHEALTGVKTPEEAMQNAQKTVAEALK